jgi:imidazolonepropionase
MGETVDLIIENISELVTLAGPPGPRRGRAMRDVTAIADGALAIAAGRVALAGTRAEVRAAYKARKTIDAEGRVATPGLVDPHTHLPWVGSREDEFARKLEGATYAEIAKGGGGIRKTTRSVRAASTDEIVAATRKRLDRMLACGTTTVEAKSGYGLELEAERRQLEALRRLGLEQPIDIISTNMAAHEIPDELRSNRGAWLAKLTDEILPALKPLSEFCDVFCEEHVFTNAETRTILEAARKLGYKLKVHADELEGTGGAELAADLGCTSADHLGRTSEKGVLALARSKTVAVLLPGTTWYLHLPVRAPARALIDAGAAVALATDCNPGSCLTESQALMLTIGCVELRMTPAEALIATTVNAAHAIDRGHDRGSLEFGKWADVVLWDAPSWGYIPSHFGVSLVDRVVKRGRLVYERGRFLHREAAPRTTLTDTIAPEGTPR